MKVIVTFLQLAVLLGSGANAFLPGKTNNRQYISTSTSSLFANTAVSDDLADSSKVETKSLGLLTFDLDDTLYPIAQIVDDANGMF